MVTTTAPADQAPAGLSDDARDPVGRWGLDDQVLDPVLDQGQVRRTRARIDLDAPRGRACGRPGSRGPRTAGPLERLSIRNWIPPRSAARPMTPSRASTSRTRVCLLPNPANGGIAGYLANGRKLVGDERGLGAVSRGGRGRLGARHVRRR